MSAATTRFARVALLAALTLAFSATLSANTISVTGYATDGSDAEGAKIVLYAKTSQYPVIETEFTRVEPIVDGRPIRAGENERWQRMKLLYDAGYDQYWHTIIATTPGWHSIEYVAYTADGRWVWDSDADWIYIGG
jgi:hypothetical protein